MESLEFRLIFFNVRFFKNNKERFGGFHCLVITTHLDNRISFPVYIKSLTNYLRGHFHGLYIMGQCTQNIKFLFPAKYPCSNTASAFLWLFNFLFCRNSYFFFDRVTFQPPWSFLFVLLFFTRLTLQVYFDLI